MKLKTSKRSRKNRRHSKTRALLKRKRATIRGGVYTSACSRDVNPDTGTSYYDEDGCQLLIYDEVTTFLNNLYSQFSDEFNSSKNKDAVVRKYEQICAKKRLEVSTKYGKDYKTLMNKEIKEKSAQISQIMTELKQIIPTVNGLSERTKARLISTLKLQPNSNDKRPAWRGGATGTEGETINPSGKGILYTLCVGGITFVGFIIGGIGAIPAFFLALMVCSGSMVVVQ